MIPPAPWAVLDLELTEPAPALLAGDEAAVWAVVRYRGAFAGILRVLPSELPMTCEEVARAAAEIAAPALRGWLRHGIGFRPARIRAAPRSSGPAEDVLRDGSLIDLDRVLAEHRSRPATVSASIVICTRHRPRALAECLGSIVAEIDAGREVVVIDNGPEPETEAVVRAFAGVTYVAEPRPSLSRARNTGIAAASGDVVAFVDDDVRPEPGWLDPLVRGFEDDGVAVVCGRPTDGARHRCPSGVPDPAGIRRHEGGTAEFDAAFAGGFPRGVPIWNIGAGANMAVRDRPPKRSAASMSASVRAPRAGAATTSSSGTGRSSRATPPATNRCRWSGTCIAATGPAWNARRTATDRATWWRSSPSMRATATAAT